MGGEGDVKLSTQFTQTALSARAELLRCQTNEEEEESELVRDGEREMDRGPEDEW